MRDCFSQIERFLSTNTNGNAMLDRSISLHLPPPGPYRTPVAAAFIELRVVEYEPSVQLRSLFENGTELCLPIEFNAVEVYATNFRVIPDSRDAIP